MKVFRRVGVAVLLVAAAQLQISASGADSPTFNSPDKAVLTSVVGLSPGTSIINDTVNGDALFLNAYYSPTDRWLESYINAGATITLNWTVTGSNGAPLANQPVTLISNLNYSGAAGTTWQQAGLNGNPSGTISGTTNASGQVSFTITNTNTASGTRPTDLTTTTGAESHEGPYPWTCMVLQIGNDIWTNSPATGVNQATDRIDFIVIPPAKISGTQATKATVAKKSYTYSQASEVLTASFKASSSTVKSVPSGIVTFSTGSGTLCSATLSAGTGSCSITSTALDAGTYTLTASYSGDSVFAPSTGTSTITVAPVATTLTLTPSESSFSQSALANFGVTIALSSKYGVTPPGNVTLTLNGNTISTNGASFNFASLSPSSVVVGKNIITALYAGNADFKASSVSKTFTVTAPVTTTTTTTTTTTPTTTTPPNAGTNYDTNHGSLLWSETFAGAKGTALNTSIWTPEIGQYTGVTPNLPNWDYGTGEIETNTNAAANVSLDGLGNLAITAACTQNCQGFGNWTSARISTAGKVNFQYGQLEANIKMPAGSFNWPAFWMLGQNFWTAGWPNCGEIDIMEGLANMTSDQSTLHANYPGGGDWNGGGGVTARAPLNDLSGSFHTFGMLWAPNTISFTLDGYIYVTDTYNPSAGTVVQTYPGGGSNTFSIGGQVWPFNQPFFAILQDAIPAGTTAPNGSTGVMQVNWIRYYSYNGYGAVTP